jgi:hypothetical protein
MWKKANVCPVWKNKGCRREPTNYRPISIIPILARTIEKVAASQLYEFCDANDILPIQQYGFRRRSNCEMALLSALESWRGSLDNGDMVGALLIDLSKAFDTVPHDILLLELADVGCSTGTLDWFHSYLSGRQQRVVQQNTTTPWKPVTRGVPQGSGLSPLLFNVYVRKLPANSLTETVQFADDVTHSTAGKSLEVIAHHLTEAFKRTEIFCKDHELKINSAKTQLLIMKSPSKRIPDDFEIVLDGCHIKPEASVKLLGVTLDRHLTFGCHIDGVVKRCQGLLSILYKASPYLPRELLRMTYVALIRSHLEYSSALFSSAAKCHLRKLDVIQKRAARVICGVPRNAHSASLLKMLELDSLESRRDEHMVDLVNSFISGNCHPAFRNFFVQDINGMIEIQYSPKRAVGLKRFCVTGAKCFNKSRIAVT